MPFTPIAGKARWKIVYDMVKGLDIGDQISYRQLGRAMNLTREEDRVTVQGAVRQALPHLEVDEKKTLVNVPNVGYRVAEPAEHVVLARKHQGRALRQLTRGHSRAVNVDLSEVDSNTRRALEMIAQGFALQMDFNRRFDVRQRNMERALSTVAKNQDRTAEEIEALKERLHRLEND